jgi:hypothetical protein
VTGHPLGDDVVVLDDQHLGHVCIMQARLGPEG